MKKKLLLFTCLIISSFIYSAPFDNPFWEHGINYDKSWDISTYLLCKPQLHFNFSTTVDYADGIYFGAFQQIDGELRLSRIFNFETTFKLGENIPTLDTFGFSWNMYPIPYLKIYTNYKLRNFAEYSILENNISTGFVIYFDFDKMPKWLDIEFMSGVNFRFIVLDINSKKMVYKEDWLSEIFLQYQLKFMFHPAFVYSFGFSWGNYDKFVVYTANYWQLEFYNYFHVIKNLSIFLNGGFSYSGSFPFAGIINRGWGEIGVRYVFKS